MSWKKKSSNTFYIAFDRTSQQSCGKGGPWRMPYSVLKFVARLSFWPLSLHLAIVHVCIAQANNLSLPLPPLPWPCLCSLHALDNSNNQFFCGVSACSERKWKDPYQTVGHLDKMYGQVFIEKKTYPQPSLTPTLSPRMELPSNLISESTKPAKPPAPFHLPGQAYIHTSKQWSNMVM